MSLNVKLRDAVDNSELRLPIKYYVNRYSHHAIGGPEECSVSIRGVPMSLSELVRHLRAPVTLYDDRGSPVWWGILYTLELRFGVRTISVSLGGMANKIAIAYSKLNPGAVSASSKVTTAWASDAASIARYGTKEYLHSLSDVSAEVAEATRDMLLYQNKLPKRSDVTGTAEGGSYSGLFTAKGWFHTLGWQMCPALNGSEQYTETGEGVQEFGVGTSSAPKVAQQFTPATDSDWYVEQLGIKVKKVGSPTDNLVLAMKSESGGVPGVDLATAQIAGSSLNPTSYEWLRLTIARTQMVYGTNYWLEVRRDGAPDVNNYYKVDVNEELGYTRGVFRIWDGDSWEARSPDADMLFEANVTKQTTVQMIDVLENYAQFVSGYEIVTQSGVYSNPYRTGETTAAFNLRELMKTGTSNGLRYLCTMTPDRFLTIYEEPQNVEYVVDEFDVWRNNENQVVPKASLSAGKWYRLSNLPPTMACDEVQDPGKHFMERTTYTVLDDALQVDPPDSLSIGESLEVV